MRIKIRRSFEPPEIAALNLRFGQPPGNLARDLPQMGDVLHTVSVYRNPWLVAAIMPGPNAADKPGNDNEIART